MHTDVNRDVHRRRPGVALRALRLGLGAALIFSLAFSLAMPQATAQPRRSKSSKADTSDTPTKTDGSELIEQGLYSCGKARGRVSVSFKPEVKLNDLITWAMGFTCKNFVFAAGVGGRSAKVTIIAPKKMSPRQAWKVFLVALRTMNLTIVQKGNVLKVMEAPQAKSSSLPIYRRSGPVSDQLIRVMIRPRHMPADDLATALNALKSKDGTVTNIGKTGVVLVTDYGNHIAKMKTLLRAVDRPVVGEKLYMIKVQHADVTELATKLQEILGVGDTASPSRSRSTNRSTRRRGRRTPTKKPSGGKSDAPTAVPSKIMADERINALIVLGSEAAYMRVRALVRRLDIRVDVEGAGRIHVYDLENADAEELSTTMTTVISGISPPSASRTGSRNRRTTPARRTAGRSTGAPAFEGQVRVTHDKPTNSLVIVASVKDFVALRQVIRKLDQPRRQVFIEASILEVNVSSALDLGTSFHGGNDLDSGAIALGGVQHDDLKSLSVASLATKNGMLGGLIGPLLDNAQGLLGTSIPSFGVLFQAFATNSNVNVLSSPHILTTDNEQAEISVGQNIPYQASLSGFGGATGATGAAGGFGGIPVQSIQRQDVALTLKITPHINASDMVRLEIDQEISDIADPNFEGNGPSWSKRTIKTTVVVRDQQSIVIGGLMSERETHTESKVPLLGDIPLFGYLFKYSSRSKAKTNLLVILTPYVIKDQMDIEQIVQKKTRERNEFVRSFITLSRMKYRPKVDYRRKRGLIAEINRMVRLVEKEADILKSMDNKVDEYPDGPIEGNGSKAGDNEDSGDKVSKAKGAADGSKTAAAASSTSTSTSTASSTASTKQGKKAAAQ